MDFCHYPAIPPPLREELPVFPEEPCSYFPGRPSRYRAFRTSKFSPLLYHELMDAGFRRSGEVFYQPACRGCRECVPIRVPIAEFKPNKTQRRVWRANTSLQLTAGSLQPTLEKFKLYQRYMEQWHERESSSVESFVEFLYRSPVATMEFCYRDEGERLVAVGICDLCAHSLSSVYFYFDPAERRRSLGTFGALAEIEFARSRGIPFYYLGYRIAGCPAMSYKANFKPHELLGPDGVWRRNAAS